MAGSCGCFRLHLLALDHSLPSHHIGQNHRLHLQCSGKSSRKKTVVDTAFFSTTVHISSQILARRLAPIFSRMDNVFSLGGDLFPHSPPPHTSFDFDLAMETSPSPKSEPNPIVDGIFPTTLTFPTAEEQQRLEQWIEIKKLNVPPARAQPKSEPCVVKKKGKRAPIVMHPFVSCENTEFCVKTLTAIARGQPPPLPLREQILRLPLTMACAQ